MSTDESRQLARVKVDASGVDVAVSRDLPALFRRLIPTTWAARRDGEIAIAEKIVQKLRDGCGLDPAEEAFAVRMMGEPVSRYVRLQAVLARAGEVHRQLPASTENAPQQAGEGEAHREREPTTSDDWLNKFREDASLVDDEVVREAYARILANEARSPTSISLRTLGVLRYLDRDVAEAFGRLRMLVVERKYVPAHTADIDNLITKAGITYEMLLAMADAGLLNSVSSNLSWKDAPFVGLRMTGYAEIVRLKPTDQHSFAGSLGGHLLTPAGVQLAAIAECMPVVGVRDALIGWIASAAPGAEVSIARLPDASWKGNLNALRWDPWTRQT